MRLFLSTLALAYLTNVALCSPSATLYGRQVNIPQQCQDACSPVTPLLTQRNCPTSQCCTEQFVTNLRDCFLCIGTTQGIQDYSQPQGSIDQFIGSCAAKGIDVPRVTLPGQDNNRSSSSFNPSTVQPPSISPSQTTASQTAPQNPTSPSSPAQSPPAQTSGNNNNGVLNLNMNIKELGVVVLGIMLGAARVL
ncbi:hypothetical protein PM082_005866 [Marasmius tenuissimus]|nr:hypothetical protein PM082_005866 [Marasmius tenuissimus]